MAVRVPDERSPTGTAIQTAQVTADCGLLKLLDILQLFLSHVRPLSHKQLHEVKQLLHRLHKDTESSHLDLEDLHVYQFHWRFAVF